MIKHSRNIGLALLTISLIGCTSPPRTVDASIPLVEPSSYVSDELILPDYWPLLNDADTKQFDHDGYSVLLSSPYDSALGTRCRQLSFIERDTIKGIRVACANTASNTKSQWFLTQPLTKEQSTVSLK